MRMSISSDLVNLEMKKMIQGKNENIYNNYFKK